MVGVLEWERHPVDFHEVVASDDYRDRRIRLKGNSIQRANRGNHRVWSALLAEYPRREGEAVVIRLHGSGEDRTSTSRNRKVHAEVFYRVAVLIQDLYPRAIDRTEPGPSEL